jgi:hypothetical protein
MSDRNERRPAPKATLPKRATGTIRSEPEIIRTRRRIGTTGASIGDRDQRIDEADLDSRIRS